MSEPDKKVICKKHGDSHATYLCGHLPSAVGAGFFSSPPTAENPHPDAWCKRCDEVLEAEGGEWSEDSEQFAAITLACAGCYEDIKARNAWAEAPSTPERFECASCGKTHEGLPYDFGSKAPALSDESLREAKLTADTCEHGEDRYIRACLELPILGGPGPLVYGVWVTLSPQSYAEFVDHREHPQRYLDGPYFGWFSSVLPGWPDTINLKTRVHLRPPPLRPVIELEPTEHPLAVAQREGITAERHREIALSLLHA